MSTLHMYFYHIDDEEDYNDEEYSLWYDKYDYNSFRKDTQTEILSVIASAVKGRRSFSGNNICMLGIEEYLSKEFFVEDMMRRVAYKKAVFVEQARQLESGNKCKKKLTSVSTRHLIWFSVKALINAGNARPHAATVKLQNFSHSSH